MSVKEFLETELEKKAEKVSWCVNNKYSSKKAQVEYETIYELLHKLYKLDTLNEEVDPVEETSGSEEATEEASF